MGAHTQTVVDRVRAGKAVKPSEMADAIAADRLAEITAQVGTEAAAQQAEAERQAAIAQVHADLDVAADAAMDRFLAAAEGVESAIAEINAAGSHIDDVHRVHTERLGRLRSPGVRPPILEADALEGWRQLPRNFDVEALRRWIRNRRAERAAE